MCHLNSATKNQTKFLFGLFVKCTSEYYQCLYVCVCACIYISTFLNKYYNKKKIYFLLKNIKIKFLYLHNYKSCKFNK